MKLWKLTRNEPYYDQVVGLLIRAKTEESAREIASQYHELGDEDKTEWLEAECEQVFIEGEEEIIMSDYLRG